MPLLEDRAFDRALNLFGVEDHRGRSAVPQSGGDRDERHRTRTGDEYDDEPEPSTLHARKVALIAREDDCRPGCDHAIVAQLEAWDHRPERIEPVCELAWMLRERNMHHAPYTRRGVEVPAPTDTLFVHRWIYEWGLWFEYSIAAD